MRPVKLPRVVEVALFVEQFGPTPGDALAVHIEATPERAREIALEMVRMNLLEQVDEGFGSTERCHRLVEDIRADRWHQVHDEFMAYPFYRDFYTTLDGLPSASLEDLLALLKQGETHFNRATVENLSEWGERLGSVQRNPFSKQVYTLRSPDRSIVPALVATYAQLDEKPTPWTRKRHVEIGRLREMVCQELRCSRTTFDEQLASLCRKNIGRLELSGVPITSATNKNRYKVRTVSVMTIPSELITDFNTAYYQKGITVNGRAFTLLAYHGGELRE